MDNVSIREMRSGYIRTSSGKKFYPFNPSPDQIAVEDIATGLANTCRFAGQLPEFYSVARHSIIVSNLVPAGFAMDGLFHDSAEAYLGDLVSPVKKGLPEYKEIEIGVYSSIAEAVGLRKELPAEVKIWDQIVLEDEFSYFFPEYLAEDFSQLTKVNAWKNFYSSPSVDRFAFLARYWQLKAIQ
jgi:hypothetical protein